MAILELENGEESAMKINQLIANNINKLDAALPADQSLGIAGLSGSGKTTFCQTIGEESKNVSFPYCQRLIISIYFLI
jgi:excinuclease UvrABC ATPase subunit